MRSAVSQTRQYSFNRAVVEAATSRPFLMALLALKRNRVATGLAVRPETSADVAVAGLAEAA
jgi:hypothetical protein